MLLASSAIAALPPGMKPVVKHTVQSVEQHFVCCWMGGHFTDP